jgi:hypothetical protein
MALRAIGRTKLFRDMSTVEASRNVHSYQHDRMSLRIVTAC